MFRTEHNGFLPSWSNAELIRLQQKELDIVKEINRLSDVSESVTDRMTLALQHLPPQGKRLDENGMFIPWNSSERTVDDSDDAIRKVGMSHD